MARVTYLDAVSILNKYELVIKATKRARELIKARRSNNPLTIGNKIEKETITALREVLAKQ